MRFRPPCTWDPLEPSCCVWQGSTRLAVRCTVLDQTHCWQEIHSRSSFCSHKEKKCLLLIGRNLITKTRFLLTVFSSQYYTVGGMQRTFLCVLMKTCSNGRIFHSRIFHAYKNDLPWRIGCPNTQITQYNLLFSWCSLVQVLWIKSSVR